MQILSYEASKRQGCRLGRFATNLYFDCCFTGQRVAWGKCEDPPL
jgi:hypothetical protein